MTCPTCNGSKLVLVREWDSSSRAGYKQFAKPCPECSAPYRGPDRKMAAAGEYANEQD